MYFVQCKDCEECYKDSTGYFCDKNNHDIDNPEIDGCTWGKEKNDNERKAD
jgi:hypothetical protein